MLRFSIKESYFCSSCFDLKLESILMLEDRHRFLFMMSTEPTNYSSILSYVNGAFVCRITGQFGDWFQMILLWNAFHCRFNFKETMEISLRVKTSQWMWGSIDGAADVLLVHRWICTRILAGHWNVNNSIYQYWRWAKERLLID